MRRALELAWESFGAGSLGIGAVLTRHGRELATGRNRLAESDPGDDVLAGTSLAHAELNVLAKLPWRSPGEGLELWTTLQPCLQCLGAIRLSPVPRVHVLAPDPLFRGVEAARHLNAFIGRRWPEVIEAAVDEWAALSLLFQTHAMASSGIDVPGWEDALPALASLAGGLVASGELVDLAEAGAPLDAVADALWARLTPCVADVARVAATPVPDGRPGDGTRAGA